MRLGSPTVSRSGSAVRIGSRLRWRTGEHVLWFECDARFASHLTTSCMDGFAVAGLLLAMDRGEKELELEGCVSERLLHNLNSYLVPLLRLMTPSLSGVSIHADRIDAGDVPRGTGVVTGFSAGVDSFCTIAMYLSPGVSPGYRLTHLVFCNVGSHGRGTSGRQLFQARSNLARRFGEDVGLPFIQIDSNLADLLRIPFEATHVLRNAAAVLQLQGLFAKYLYSSGFKFADCAFGETPYMATLDPAVVHLLSTERLECISTGCQFSRVEKTRLTSQVVQARTMLNVCQMPSASGANCSKCAKCLRTLVTLELLGELDNFRQVFDVDSYRRSALRAYLLAALPARTTDPYVREISELSRLPTARTPRFAAMVRKFWPILGPPFEIARYLRHLNRRG